MLHQSDHNKVETRLQLQMSGLPWGLVVMWASYASVRSGNLVEG